MAIVCPSCWKEVPATDLDRKRMIAHCRTCSSVFDCSNAPVSESSAALGPQRRRARVPMPESFTITEGPRDLADPGYRQAPRGGPPMTIVRRWYTPVAWGVAAFSVFWNVVLYRSVFSDWGAPALLRIFPLIHLAVGFSLLYWALALLRNRTTIVITDDELSVTHGPVPWPGKQRIAISELTQLFTEERLEQGRSRERRFYDLSAVMKDGRRKKLVKGLSEPAQALFLEQRIEERLGIVDVEVGGEYRA